MRKAPPRLLMAKFEHFSTPSGYPGYVGGDVLRWLASKGIELVFPRDYPVQRAMIAVRPDRWGVFIEEHKRVNLSVEDELWLRRVIDE